jgi:hypothetical protein
MRKWRYSSTIFDLSTKRRDVICFMPLLLYPPRNEPFIAIG